MGGGAAGGNGREKKKKKYTCSFNVTLRGKKVAVKEFSSVLPEATSGQQQVTTGSVRLQSASVDEEVSARHRRLQVFQQVHHQGHI